MKKNHALSGFTLIELLTVISIMSLLSSIVISNINITRARARDTLRINDARNIIIALQSYYLDHNSWPYIVDAADPANRSESCSARKCSVIDSFGFSTTFCQGVARCQCGFRVDGSLNETKWFTYLDDYFALGHAPHDPQNDTCQLGATRDYRYIADADSAGQTSFEFQYVLEAPSPNALGRIISPTCRQMCGYSVWGDEMGAVYTQ